MPKKSMETLTESMFYVLIAFCRGPLCGIEAGRNGNHGVFDLLAFLPGICT